MACLIEVKYSLGGINKGLRNITADSEPGDLSTNIAVVLRGVMGDGFINKENEIRLISLVRQIIEKDSKFNPISAEIIAKSAVEYYKNKSTVKQIINPAKIDMRIKTDLQQFDNESFIFGKDNNIDYSFFSTQGEIDPNAVDEDLAEPTAEQMLTFDETMQGRKEDVQQKMAERRNIPQGITWSKIVMNMFPGASAIADEMYAFVQTELFNNGVIDRTGVPVLSKDVGNAINKVQKSLGDAINTPEIKALLKQLDNLPWGKLQNFLMNNPPVDVLEAYKLYVAATTFEALVTDQGNFGKTVTQNKETKEWTIKSSAIKGDVRKDHANEGVTHAFNSGSKVFQMILENTPKMVENEHVRGTFNAHPTDRISKNSTAVISTNLKLNQTNPTIEDFVEAVSSIINSKNNPGTSNVDPRLVGIYNRFFNREVFILDGVKTRSLYKVVLDGTTLVKDGDTEYFTRTEEAKLANDMLVEFVSNFSQVSRFDWLNINNGKLEIEDKMNATISTITGAFEYKTEYAKSGGSVNVRYSGSRVTVGDFSFNIADTDGEFQEAIPTKVNWELKDYDSMLHILGFNVPYGFANEFISTYGDEKILNNIIAKAAMGIVLNNRADDKDFAILGYSEDAIKKNREHGKRLKVGFDEILNKDLEKLIFIFNDMFDLDTTIMAVDADGNRKLSMGKAFPLLRTERRIEKLKKRRELLDKHLKDFNDSGKKDTEALYESVRQDFTNAHNGFVDGRMSLERFVIKNSINDESHMKLDDKGSMLLNLDAYFQRAEQKGFKEALFDFFVPSDKSKYPTAAVRFVYSDIMPELGGKSNDESLLREYWQTVAKTVQHYQKDQIAYWTANMVMMGKFENHIAFKEAAINHLVDRELKNGDSNIYAGDVDLIKNNITDEEIEAELASYFKLNGEDERSSYIKTDKDNRFKSIDELQTAVAAMRLTQEDIEGTGLILNRDYLIEDKKVILNPHLITYFKNHSDKNETRKMLNDQLGHFISDIQTMGIKHLPYQMNRIISSRFEPKEKNPKWKDGAIMLGGEINPGLVSYFYQWNTVSNNLMLLNQGLVFDYGVKKEDAKDYTEAEAGNFVSQIKRNVSLTSDFHQPVLQTTTKEGIPIDVNGENTPTRLLSSVAKVAYFNDIELPFDLINNGGTKGQEVLDGAIFINPITLLKYNHSFGDEFSALKSSILKNIITNRDDTRGATQFIKMASHQITTEMMANSKGNDSVDMYKMMERMLSIPFPNGPTKIKFKSKYLGKEISSTYNTQWDIFLALDGMKNNNVWHEILDIEFAYPQIANQHVQYVMINTSVKVGKKKTNKDIRELLANPEEKLIISNLDHSTTGIQLNPFHDPQSTRDGVAVPTQVVSSAINESKSYDQVTQILEATARIGKHKLDSMKDIYKDKTIMDAANVEAAKKIDKVLDGEKYDTLVNSLADLFAVKRAVMDELIFSAIKDGDYDGVVEKLMNEKQSMDSPQFDKMFSSKLTAMYTNLGIRMKMNGGGYVVTPVSEIEMIYVLPDGTKTMRPGYEKWVTENPEKAASFGINKDTGAKTLNSTPGFKVRNLKPTSYFLGDDTTIPDVDENGKPVIDENGKPVYVAGMDIKDTIVFQHLRNKYNELKAAKKNKQNVETATKNYKNALAAYNAVLNGDRGSITVSPGELLLPATMGKKYGLKVGDDLSSILNDTDYFYNQWRRKKMEKEGFPWTPQGKKDFKEKHGAEKLKGVHQHHYKRHKDFVESLQGIVARIPASGKQSANAFVVVGFKESLDNAVGIPAESMIIKGEDLDIDKGYVLMKDQDDTGFIFPYYTDLGENNPKGHVLTKKEIFEMFPKEYKRLELKYQYISKYDWYEKGLNNLIITNLQTVFNDAKNAVEANTPTETENIKAYKEKLKRFSVNNPASTVMMSTVNKTGVTMVGVMAAASKASSLINYTAQKEINEGRWDTGEDDNHFNNRTFTMAYRSPKRKGDEAWDNRFSKVANTSDTFKKEKELEEFIQLMSGQEMTPEMQESLDQLKSQVSELRAVDINKEHSWEIFSQLINSATDNAKLLILGSTNTSTITGAEINTMIILGVSFSDIFDFITSPEVIELTKLTQADKYSSDLSTFIKNKGKKVRKGASTNMKDVIDTIISLSPFVEDFRIITTMAGINQEIKNDVADQYKYSSTMDTYLKEKGIRVTLFDFVNSSPEERMDIIEQLDRNSTINLLRVINSNTHFLQFIRSMAEVREIRNENMITFSMTDSLTDASGINIDADKYNLFHRAVHSMMIDEYLKKEGTIKFNNSEYDFSSIVERVTFMKDMHQMLETLQMEYPGNAFITRLNVQSRKNLFTGDKYKHISSPNANRINARIRVMMQGGLNSLNYDLKRQMYLYSLMMQSSNNYTDTFGSLFDGMDTELNEFRLDLHKNHKKDSSDFERQKTSMIKRIMDMSPEFYESKSYEEFFHIDLWSLHEESMKDKLIASVAYIFKKNPDSGPVIKRYKTYDPILKKTIFMKAEFELTENGVEVSINFPGYSNSDYNMFGVGHNSASVFGMEIEEYTQYLGEEYENLGVFDDEPSVKLPEAIVPSSENDEGDANLQTGETQYTYTMEKVESMILSGLIKTNGDC